MSIKSIKVINVMVLQRQWRKNDGDPKTGYCAFEVSDGEHTFTYR